MASHGQQHANDDHSGTAMRPRRFDFLGTVRLFGLIAKGDSGEHSRTPAGHRERSEASARGNLNRQNALVERAQLVLVARRTRERYFNPAMFGEPAWDMLLHLYVAERLGEPLGSITLSDRVDVPLSSAIRWIDYLEEERLVERLPDPSDREVTQLGLTDSSRKRIEEYLACGAIAGLL